MVSYGDFALLIDGGCWFRLIILCCFVLCGLVLV